LKSKKELKNEYKQMKFQIGVFQIKNQINNKVMLDSSVNITAKCNRHRIELNLGSHINKDLQKDWIIHGEDNFTFEILSELKHKENNDDLKEVTLLEKMMAEEFETNGILFYNN
jgi:hypothetical protein